MARNILFVSAYLFLLPGMLLSGEPVSSQTATGIELGPAAISLYGPWKFTVGDSPIDSRSGRPLWAEPDFDDSRWETADLTPGEGALDPLLGTQQYVPGWTAHGHPGYWGYAWYRIHLQVHTTGEQALALEGSEDVDDAYQVFANGQLEGSFGRFSGSRAIVYGTVPAMFPIDEHGSGAATVIAIRFWMQPSTLALGPDAGGMHTAPILGERSVVALHHKSKMADLVRKYLFTSVEAIELLLFAMVAFSLTFFDRHDRAYLWMGVLFLATALDRGATVWANCVPVELNRFNLFEDFLFSLTCALCIMVWWVWFGRIGPRWIPHVAGTFAVLLMVSSILSDEVFYGSISHAAASRFHTLSTGLRVLLFALLVKIAIDAIRHHGLDGWLLVPILLLRGVTWFYVELAFFHVRIYYFPFGIWVSPGLITRFLESALIAFLLLRRLLGSIKRQKEMALDVKQAQEVQHVILPERRIALPGIEIESEYRSAREVGGDFFQIIPTIEDGGLLIVAGDVAGKGLQAGMLVALLVGAIRTAAEMDTNPMSILAALNRRLLGRGDARATCLALTVSRDGAVVLANAGHLPPYLNGEPIEIEGSLPLGVLKQLDPTVRRFRLVENDRLFLLSDGVAEARNQHGTLFGFDRVQELVSTQPTAAKIADIAQAFGQEDDISVISIFRRKIAVPAIS